MTTHEQQEQRVIGVRVDVRVDRQDERLLLGREHFFAAASRLLAACLIGEPAKADLNQPGARIVGQTFARPSERGRDERLLHRVLAA